MPGAARAVETGLFVVPPFPDIAMKKEDFLRRLGLNWLAKQLESDTREKPSILDFFMHRSPTLEQDVMKFGFLEQSPKWFKRRWGHHRFLLFERSVM